jgi:predicted Zn finger-like uncharacterized protein
MKIVCESCQAKYSIADEKVAGKVFKIRCKRCSEVIIVRGDQPSGDEAAGGAAEGVAEGAVWHVVIDGEQFGPYVPEQIGELLANNQIDWEAYVWREGFDNWLPACDVPELVDAIMGPAGQAEQAPALVSEPAPAPEVSADPLADAPALAGLADSGPASMGADPFADDGDAGGGGIFGEAESAAGADVGADLFSPDAAASPFEGAAESPADDGVIASGASPELDASGQPLTGARNENSVLFSLKNLQALATGSSAGTPAPSFESGAQPGAGLAAGEGSGLIDIRALASAAGIGGAEDQEGEKDELLAIGAQTGAFGALGSPMAPAAPMEEGSKNKMVIAVLGGAALLGLAMIGVAFIMRPTAEPSTAAATVAPGAEVQPAKPGAPDGEKKPATPAGAPKPEEPLSEGEKAARAAAEGEKAATAEEDEKERTAHSTRKARSDSRPRGGGDSTSAAPKRTSSAREESAPAKPKRSTGNESIDDLLAGALGGGSKRPAKRTSSAPTSKPSNLPRTPSRDDVLKALRGVQPAVSACAQGQRGVAMADIVVGNSGRVKSVRVSQVTGPVASCIARAVRRARFPKFSDPKFSVKFPFRL